MAIETDERAARAHESFNRRYWYAEGGYLYDVIDGEDGDDPSLRPNQLFAVSLPHPVLAEERFRAVVDVVAERLLTPYGLRTLDPAHADYHPRYDDDPVARDAAYHQGLVWPWLIGPFVDAWQRVYADARRARTFLDPLLDHLKDAGVGAISEIFDAEKPYTPRGAMAQAWSVAEVLRVLVCLDADATDRSASRSLPV